MRKLNIYGLQKRCKEFWRGLKSLIYGFDIFKGIYLEESDIEEPETEEDGFEILEVLEKEVSKTKVVLDDVDEFFQSYIGVLITGFTTFHDEIEDIEMFLQAKMIVSTVIRGESLCIGLARPNGQSAGHIKLSPKVDSRFLDSDGVEEPTLRTRYRLYFYGGDCLEYIDADDLGMISYHSETLMES